MSLIIKQIVNCPITSNCFVLYDKAVGNDCIIVDPGCRDCRDIIDYICRTDLNPKYIILTHEHFDHCWGVNELVVKYQVLVICSALCADKIKDAKKNCSVFYNNKLAFEVNCDTISVESLNLTLDFNGHPITFYHTSGHTDASISFTIDNYLFTGDTLIKDLKTVTKLPGGSVTNLKVSLALYDKLEKDYQVMAGHGNSFQLSDYDLYLSI